MSKKQYNPGKVKPLIHIVARLVQQDPSLADKLDLLFSRLEDEIPELKDKSRCANCDASMVQYIYDINTIDMALVINMGQAVKEAQRAGKSFTEANNVHVPTLPVYDAVRRDITRCSKLGLITKFLKDDQHIAGRWLITKKGFAALRGEAVKTGITIWRNRIIDRSEKMVTFNEIRANAKNIRHDEVINYDHNDWVEFAGFHNGRLF